MGHRAREAALEGGRERGFAAGAARVLRRAWAVPEVGILVPLVAVTLVFARLNPVLLRPQTIRVMLKGVAFVGIIAVGQTFLMISGELDLSVGSVAGLCAIVSSWLMKNKGWPVEAGVLAGLAAGALTGLGNGLIAVRLGVPAFIATLGMFYIARGFNYLICAGYPITPLPASLNAFGEAEPLGISWSFLICAGIAIAGDFVLRRTVFGRMVYATGGNREVADLAGINTRAVKIACYVATGLLAGLSGMLVMAQFNVGQPEIGRDWELEVIASVVIGGVSLFGGIGTVLGSVIGLLFMQVVRTGLVVTGVNTHWQTVAVGVIMIGAVGIDLLRRRAKLS